MAAEEVLITNITPQSMTFDPTHDKSSAFRSQLGREKQYFGPRFDSGIFYAQLNRKQPQHVDIPLRVVVVLVVGVVIPASEPLILLNRLPVGIIPVPPTLAVSSWR